MADSIELPFGVEGWVGPRNHVPDGVQIAHGMGHFFIDRVAGENTFGSVCVCVCVCAVSYTHLTLPTIYSV